MKRRTRRTRLKPGRDFPLPPPYPPETQEEWLESTGFTGQDTPSFDDYHRRHLDEAVLLKGHVIFVAGIGATGSLVAAHAARSGFDVSLVDREPLEVENMHRHEANADFLGENKASALAKTLRAELPGEQRIRSANADLEEINDRQLTELIAKVAPGVSVIVGATGNDAVDRRLNTFCQRAGIRFVVPGLYRADHPSLGEIQTIPCDRPGEFACFECLRPTRPRARPLEAQEVPAEDVAVLARETIKVRKALVLPEAGAGPLYADRLDHGRNYLLINRGSMQVQAAVAPRRPGCRGCLVPLPPDPPTPRRRQLVDPGSLQRPDTRGRRRRAVNSRTRPWRIIRGIIAFFGWIWSWSNGFDNRPWLKNTIACLSGFLIVATIGLAAWIAFAAVMWIITALVALVKLAVSMIAVVLIALVILGMAWDVLLGEA